MELTVGEQCPEVHPTSSMVDEVYEVDKLLKARGRGKARQFLVKWVGYDAKESTWEPRKNVHPDLVTDFEEAEAKLLRRYNDDDEDDEDEDEEEEEEDGDDGDDRFWEEWAEKKASEPPSTTAKAEGRAKNKAHRVSLGGKRKAEVQGAPKVAPKSKGSKAVPEQKDAGSNGAAAAKGTLADKSEAEPEAQDDGEGKRKRKRAPRPVMSLEDAQQLAAAENLQLVPSARQSKAGYIGVGFHGPHSCAVRAAWQVGGVETYLGSFSGVHEAALAVARHLGPEESARQAAKVAAKLAAEAEEAAQAPEGMSLEEAWRIAREEGIELLTSTANMCVDRQPNARRRICCQCFSH